VQVVNVGDAYVRLGGAANVAHGLAALGAKVELIGVIGNDPPGEQLRMACATAGVGCEGLIVDSARPTTRKLRVVARHQHVLRLDWEEARPYAAQPVIAAFEKLAKNPPDVIVLSDYAKGTLAETAMAHIISWARARGVPVLVDPKRNDVEAYRGASVVTPNAKELAAAVGDPAIAAAATRTPGGGPSELGRVERGARALIGPAGCEAVVVTLGENGMLVVPRDQAALHIKASAREVFDVTGAGDTVIALLALGMATRLPLDVSAELATVAAGLVVEKVGTAVVRPHELISALAPSEGGKVMSRDELVERLEWWRLLKKTVVFTNGCFDVLHAGHITLLREAKRHGDVLVVAINSDDSVKRLKGKGRPLIGEGERALILSALECVDAVVMFDEDTPGELISAAVPDVLVKGGDYKPENVVGRDVVERGGGRLVLVPLVEGRSTTRLVEKMRGT
jgi:D-beta-D-heptose 7-phosphate kinase/D-beta-D-heptose 1-phosphate adenosyltransferase